MPAKNEKSQFYVKSISEDTCGKTRLYSDRRIKKYFVESTHLYCTSSCTHRTIKCMRSPQTNIFREIISLVSFYQFSKDIDFTEKALSRHVTTVR